MRKLHIKSAIAFGLILGLVAVIFSPYVSYAAILEEDARQMQIDALMAERDKAFFEEDEIKIAEINNQLELLGVERLQVGLIRQRLFGESEVSPRIIVPDATEDIIWDSSTGIYPYGGVTYEIQYIYASPTTVLSDLFEKSSYEIPVDSSYDWGAVAFELFRMYVAGSVSGNPLLTYAVTVAEFIEAIASGQGTTISITNGDSITYKIAHRTTVKFAYINDMMASDVERLALIATRGYTTVGCFYLEDHLTYSDPVSKSYDKYSYSEDYNTTGRNLLIKYLEDNQCIKSYVTEVVISAGTDEDRMEICEIWPYIPGSMSDLLR